MKYKHNLGDLDVDGSVTNLILDSVMLYSIVQDRG